MSSCCVVHDLSFLAYEPSNRVVILLRRATAVVDEGYSSCLNGDVRNFAFHAEKVSPIKKMQKNEKWKLWLSSGHCFAGKKWNKYSETSPTCLSFSCLDLLSRELSILLRNIGIVCRRNVHHYCSCRIIRFIDLPSLIFPFLHFPSNRKFYGVHFQVQITLF